jgi:hypothetical protein
MPIRQCPPRRKACASIGNAIRLAPKAAHSQPPGQQGAGEDQPLGRGRHAVFHAHHQLNSADILSAPSPISSCANAMSPVSKT